jgi:peptidoglycan/LPS O-acetylase OafA/YrhL
MLRSIGGEGGLEQPRRIGFLDGLRGIAALQVVGLHYVSAFLPAIALLDASHPLRGWEALSVNSPLFLAIDGYAAVYVFFLISGAALTYAFQGRRWTIAAVSARRLIRLGLPMTVSVTFAAGLLWLMPAAHVTAGHLSGSDHWLTGIGPVRLGIAPMVKEVLLGGMLAGHTGQMFTMLPAGLATALHLSPANESFNSPLWSLHFEFYGSLLVLGLVAARARLGDRNHAILSALLLVVLTAHPIGLFVIGHLLAPLIASPRWVAITRRPAMPVLGAATIGLAMMLARYRLVRVVVDPATAVGDFFQLPGRLDDLHVQSSLIALLVLASAMMTLPMQRILLSRPCQWFGRISFSLYLIHFPILFTVSAWVYVKTGGQGIGMLMATVVGLAVTIPLACLFESTIDRVAIRLSHRVPRTGSWFRAPGTAAGIAPPAGTNA